jgi:CO/xanthine dehydrogenase FAD-binding subunit
MNLNTITEVKRPASADQITQWRDGYAWLAGGTWLFSEPQVATDTLIDLDQLNWPALEPSPAGLDIAATCTVAELYRFAGSAEWCAVPLLRECCNAFLASFKTGMPPRSATSACRCRPAR